MISSNVVYQIIFVIMDSKEKSSSLNFSKNLNCDGANKDSCKASSKTASTSADDNVFTNASSYHADFNSYLVANNGPSTLCTNSESNQTIQRSNVNNQNSSECNRNQLNQTASFKISCLEPAAIPSTSRLYVNSCDNGINKDHEASCQKTKCTDKSNISLCFSNTPSGSGINRQQAMNILDSNCCKESRKRPSSLKLNRLNVEEDGSSSDTGNDDYSLGSEDGCIYTYRGGEHLADLPSSFFSLDMGLPIDRHLPQHPNYAAPQNARGQGSRASSPEMDFLEMDFDPGPSCDADTENESSPDADLDIAETMPEEVEPIPRGTTPEYSAPKYVPHRDAGASTSKCNIPFDYCAPSTSRDIISQVEPNITEEPSQSEVFGPNITHVNIRGEHLLVRRTRCESTECVQETNVTTSLHISSGDLVSPREILNFEEEEADGLFSYQVNQQFDSVNLSLAHYHHTMAKRLMTEQIKEDTEKDTDVPDETQPAPQDECVEPPRAMVWSEREACERQVTQIGTSACGATAVVNVFIALGVPANIEKISAAIGTRQRANNAPLPRYILSRAVAGCTAADLVSGLQRASDGLVTARFFPTFPERAMSLSHWLADWISLGAVPILTLNLQVGNHTEIPDAWHHQMVFGVSQAGVYMCNPVECVKETDLWARLTSASVLLVRTRDVLSRFSPQTDLRPLMAVPDPRFHTFNVLGQIVNVIREWRSSGWSDTRTRHIRIPASYQAGITIAALTGSEAHRRLMHVSQLPVLSKSELSDKEKR